MDNAHSQHAGKVINDDRFLHTMALHSMYKKQFEMVKQFTNLQYL